MIKVREVEFDDLKPVFELGHHLFKASAFPILYRNWDEYEILDRFMSDSQFCLLAEDEKGKLAGFIIGSIIKKPKSSWTYGYINWMGVNEKFQGAGIGKKLYNSLGRRFKRNGVNMLMADTSPKNTDALKFFRKRGFNKEENHVYLFKNLNG